MSCCKAIETGSWCSEIHNPDYERVYKDENGNEYCLFHAPHVKKGMSVENFNKIIFNRISAHYQSKKNCNLSGTIFPNKISFDRFDDHKSMPAVNFGSCVFCGDVSFKRVNFSAETIFDCVHFCERVDFYGAKFNGPVYFSGITCENEEVIFSGAIFNDNLLFSAKIQSNIPKTGDKAIDSHVKFAGTIYNGNSQFSIAYAGGISFNLAVFKKDVQFLGEVGFIGFCRTKFDGEAIFRINIVSETDFLDARFTEKAFFYTCIGASRFSNVIIEKMIRFEELNLEKTSFIGTDLTKIDFVNCKWVANNSRTVLYDELTLRTQKPTEANEAKKIEILYRKLKQKSITEYNYPEASSWHYGEKEMRRFYLGFNQIEFYLLRLYKYSSGYGEMPNVAGLVLFNIILYISILLSLFGINSFENGFYYYDFSAVIINTLQYATFQKETIFSIKQGSAIGYSFKILGQILIPIQATLFALSVRNKFRR